MKNSISTFILFLLSIAFVFAHGDLDTRIAQATKEISASPQNSDLYFHRGKLYYQHEEYQKGIEDFDKAVTYGCNGEQVHLFKSKCFYELQQYESAIEEIQLFFTMDPEHVVAHKLHGQILNKQGKYKESALEFEYVISNSIRPLPENYIDASQSWSALREDQYIDKAVNILQQGLESNGALITLQNQLISLLIENNRYNQAISIQKRIVEKLNRKESAYFKLFELAELNKDTSLAIASLTNAEKSWNLLPKRLQKNSAMIKLKSEIQLNLINYNSKIISDEKH